jgi:hypothetical protein
MSEGEAEALKGKSSALVANANEHRDDHIRSHIPGSRWRTSGAAYGIMMSLLLLGLLSAISHHLFYSYLHNRAIDEAAVSQNWSIRIGNAFAYLFKTALVAAVAVAYAQGFWYFARRKSLEIGLLDNCFGVLYNPLGFSNCDFLQKTTLLFGLALVSWLLPISAVFAPGTLTGYLILQIG